MFNCIVIQSSNQIHAQHKPPAPILIPLGQNPKDFQMADDVFDHHALRCQGFVMGFLLISQLAAFRRNPVCFLKPKVKFAFGFFIK